MTATVDIANRALILIGSQKQISSLAQDSLEAQTANAIITQLRDELNRMAPWDCVTKFANLVYITTIPGNPENANAGAPLWQPGIPAPPWAYEYQYPVDCLRARQIIPQYTGQVGGIPIYPAGVVTGGGQPGGVGAALKFKVSTDAFVGVISASVVSGGTGYVPNDIITLVQPSYTFQQNSAPVGQPPVYTSYTMDAGAPAQLLVTSVTAGGVVFSVSVINQVLGEAVPVSGSYFGPQPAVVPQGSTSGVGTGATFNLVGNSFTPQPQRVILTNQPQAILQYNAQITDPNIMDALMQEAWVHVLAGRMCYQLNADKAQANTLITIANQIVIEARKADGNEGLTINDVMPDFLRIRGGYGIGPNFEYSPSFDWGATFALY